MTIKCSGRTVFSKIDSLVKKGTPSSPGIGGTAARLPVATTKRRAWMLLAAGLDRLGVDEAAARLDDPAAETR